MRSFSAISTRRGTAVRAGILLPVLLIRRKTGSAFTTASVARQSYAPHFFPLRRAIRCCVYCSRSAALPFLSRKKRKQKKVICGAVALRCCCLFREHAAQNGRFIWKPSVFSFRAGHAGNRLFSERKPPPQCLLFLFFKKRNRPPLEEKKSFPLEIVPYPTTMFTMFLTTMTLRIVLPSRNG